MGHDHSTWALAVLSILAGMVHVLSPDHWVPASILVWQRRWRLGRAAFFAMAAFVLHVVLGLGIFFGLQRLPFHFEPNRMFLFALLLVAVLSLIRGMRFPRIREVVFAGPKNSWAILAVFSLLGPCESIIPVFIRSRDLGTGYLLPFLAFTLGTLVCGMLFVVFGREIWNRPLWLSRGFYWARQRVTALPFTAGLILGLTFLFRLT